MRAIWAGENLRIRRKQLGLSAKELADKVGCQSPVISAWESNRVTPSGHFLVMLGEVLNSHPRDFFSFIQEDLVCPDTQASGQ